MNTRKIKTIAVEKLFGLYDYTLTIPSTVEDNVFIIYGDNGTGKSTLLRLAYHLLASETGHSHKTFLANAAFKLFYVEFSDGTRVSAERYDENDDYLGEYTIKYEGEETIECHIPCEWNEEIHKFGVGFSNTGSTSRKDFRNLLLKLKSINVYYISDNRSEEHFDTSEIRQRRIMPSDPVEREMNQLQEWVISQALEASKKGEEGTMDVYVKLLSKFGKRRNKNDKAMKLEDIASEIDVLEERATRYARLGFIPSTNYADIKSRLSKVLKTNRDAAANILEPFLETQKNRLDALDYLFETVSYFCQSLNDYLYKKHVIYSVREGFKFYQNSQESPLFINDKDEISVKKLSSGERQLLRLFSMVIRKSIVCPIIIIDEPEISLNIKWQRRLLETLNFFVRNSDAQFVVATHSFEILSSHLKNTVKIGESYIPQTNVRTETQL